MKLNPSLRYMKNCAIYKLRNKKTAAMNSKKP